MVVAVADEGQQKGERRGLVYDRADTGVEVDMIRLYRPADLSDYSKIAEVSD